MQGNGSTATVGTQLPINSAIPGDKKEKDEGNETMNLQRKIGPISSIAMVVGTMIGSGIFVSPGGLLHKTGSVWLSLVVWACCGLVATLGGMSYIELASVVPDSGAEYSYLLVAFGALPAFLYSWLCTMVLVPSGIAILCVSLAQYCIEPFVDDMGDMALAVKLVSGASILVVAYINATSVKLATLIMNYFTVAKILALIMIISVGTAQLYNGKTKHLELTFEGSSWNFGDLASAFYNGLWAYEGWNQLNLITEEIKNPHRNVALAILIGVPLVTVLYVLTNISYLTILTPYEVQNSASVANIFGERALGFMAFLMPLSIVISTFGSLNGSLFTTGRLAYVAGRRGHLPSFLSFIDMNRNTPSSALIFNGVLACFYAMALDIHSLIEVFSFTRWIFYGAAMVALIRLRTIRPKAPRPFKVPIVIPWLVLAISCFLVIAPVVQNPKFEYMYALAFICSGFLIYIPFVKNRVNIPGVDSTVKFAQILLQVLPPDSISSTTKVEELEKK